MKTILQWKYFSVAGLVFKFPWLSSPAPVFQFSEGKILLTNKAGNMIGVKMANRG